MLIGGFPVTIIM